MFGSSGATLCCHNWEKCCWHLIGRNQGSCKHSAQHSLLLPNPALTHPAQDTSDALAKKPCWGPGWGLPAGASSLGSRCIRETFFFFFLLKGPFFPLKKTPYFPSPNSSTSQLCSHVSFSLPGGSCSVKGVAVQEEALQPVFHRALWNPDGDLLPTTEASPAFGLAPGKPWDPLPPAIPSHHSPQSGFSHPCPPPSPPSPGD